MELRSRKIVPSPRQRGNKERALYDEPAATTDDPTCLVPDSPESCGSAETIVLLPDDPEVIPETPDLSPGIEPSQVFPPSPPCSSRTQDDRATVFGQSLAGFNIEPRTRRSEEPSSSARFNLSDPPVAVKPRSTQSWIRYREPIDPTLTESLPPRGAPSTAKKLRMDQPPARVLAPN